MRVLATADFNTFRGVGRKQLPTSIGGALIHVADHTQRHVGQVVTTAKVLKALRGLARTLFLANNGLDNVPHLLLLGAHVGGEALLRLDLGGDALGHCNAGRLQRRDLLGIVGDQPDLLDAQQLQHLGGHS